jgi:hypothetical protein
MPGAERVLVPFSGLGSAVTEKAPDKNHKVGAAAAAPRPKARTASRKRSRSLEEAQAEAYAKTLENMERIFELKLEEISALLAIRPPSVRERLMAFVHSLFYTIPTPEDQRRWCRSAEQALRSSRKGN